MDLRRLAIGPVVFLVAGCLATGGTQSGPPATTGLLASPTRTPSSQSGAAIVPWSAATPAPPPTPTASPTPDAPTCRADQLAAGDAGWGGATGSLLGGFLVWNTSASPCQLLGFPSVAIVDGGGRSLKVARVTIPNPPAKPIVLGLRQSAPALGLEPASGLASETLQWFNWCGASPKGRLSLAVTLPAGGELHVPVVVNGETTFVAPSTPRCDEPAMPSTVSVSAFEETPGPSPTEPPAVPAEGLRLALEVPDQATAGAALQYVAALSNPTAGAISLTPCPAYRESLVTASGQLAQDYLLDCAAVPSIGPGQTVRFAMEFEIPSSQPSTDQAALVWELIPSTARVFWRASPRRRSGSGSWRRSPTSRRPRLIAGRTGTLTYTSGLDPVPDCP